jgi:hypothetical protein
MSGRIVVLRVPVQSVPTRVLVVLFGDACLDGEVGSEISEDTHHHVHGVVITACFKS